MSVVVTEENESQAVESRRHLSATLTQVFRGALFAGRFLVLFVLFVLVF
jgi:hypothetical protein